MKAILSLSSINAVRASIHINISTHIMCLCVDILIYIHVHVYIYRHILQAYIYMYIYISSISAVKAYDFKKLFRNHFKTFYNEYIHIHRYINTYLFQRGDSRL
jgi:hypothetical protein